LAQIPLLLYLAQFIEL